MHDAQQPVVLPIAAVERDTGLSKDTLRVWERRYGFPAPVRDPAGDRAYPLEQVDKLCLLKRLLDLGHRPGRIVALTIEQLQRLAQPRAGGEARGALVAEARDDLGELLGLLRAHRVDELRGRLSQALLRRGLAEFIAGTVAPLNEMVGEAWIRGELQIFEEHLYTETVQAMLRGAIGAIPRADARPRVLLTTFPDEPHGLGILMAEATFALEGCCCISLGVRTPVREILRAVEAQRADIVALSFSAAFNATAALGGLAELRRDLPDAVEVWAGGACPAVHRRAPSGIASLRTLEAIAPELLRWRARHPSA